MSDSQTIIPWKHIWTRPRETFEYVTHRDTDYFVADKFSLWVVISGIGSGLDKASLRYLGDRVDSVPTLPGIIIGAVIGGAIGSFIGLYFWSWWLGITNKWFSGTGNFFELKMALGWATLPFALIAVLWLPNLYLFGMENFTELNPVMDNRPQLTFAYFGLSIIEAAAIIYGCIIWCKGIGVACGFSAWKALGVFILSLLTLIIPLMIIGYLLVRATGISV